MKLPRVFPWLVALCLAPVLAAFNGQVVTEGPLKVAIDAIPVVTTYDVPQACRVSLTNAGATPLAVTLELKGLIDDCRAVGDTRRQVTVAPGATAAESFAFACGRRTYSALYPVHVYATFTAEGTHTAHAVQIFETRFDPAPGTDELAVVRVPGAGALALSAVTQSRVSWAYVGGTPVLKPVGWTGTDPTSSATFARGSVTRGADARSTLQLHPPYRPKPGTVWVEYRLQLPHAKPLRLAFFNAIRDSGPTEGVSDGVTFRVWVNDRKLFERHTDAKSWTPGDADLSAFAGQTITLRLESHPGPRNNTTCDASYWGDAVIAVGEPPRVASDAERAALVQDARSALQRATGDAHAYVFALSGGLRAAVVPGPNGLADGVIAFGSAEKSVAFSGLHLAVEDGVLGVWPSAAVVTAVRVERGADGAVTLAHDVAVGDRTTTLTAKVWSDGPALRIKVESPGHITALGLNAADRRAERVYYGHGYCIVDPQPFVAQGGGHNLATSHVGFDFEGGVSLLTATDTPPDHLEVNPAHRVYRLQTHPDATLTFVPGVAGAFDCAIRYRPLSDKHAAPGVAKKAGRFVFDLWGGRYAEDATLLARCFDYGLTDALVMMHNWQRWGYDYRLPDIFPPNPSMGTLEDLQALGKLCATHGTLWGLHDNYIDFYPDAEGFSYDHVTFTPDGKPRRAWLNEYREAQSYQFRPDHIRPFLDRNLKLIVPALHPTASFVDVFSSINTIDYHDRDGTFHSRVDTQKAWGEAFAAIREACGDNAPTVSEAGGDHLIGWLDGADAQWMQLGPKPAPFHNAVACRAWERVPWFDAVNHTRFSLHGVGYSERYQGGRSREEHGIESDDYLSAEILAGHALMIDRGGMGRGAVRKHWLAQRFIASVARDEISRVEFAGDDVHRLVVTWNSGASVCVNRGESDWTVRGHVLPQYGFVAENGAISCAVERIAGGIVERSQATGEFYVNSRVFAPAAPVAIAPRGDRVEYLGDRKFRLLVDWDAQRGTRKDCAVFYHFSRPTPGRRAPTEFAGGGVPSTPTSQWRGEVVTGREWTLTIPENLPLGEYEVLVGLYDRRQPRERVRLQGDEDSSRRYRLGKLVVLGTKAAGVTGVRFEATPNPSTAMNAARWLANTGPTDFGAVVTDGAFRCVVSGSTAVVTPLPDGDPAEVRLRADRVFGRPVTIAQIDAITPDGTVQEALPVPDGAAGGELTLRLTPGVFAYRLIAK